MRQTETPLDRWNKDLHISDPQPTGQVYSIIKNGHNKSVMTLRPTTATNVHVVKINFKECHELLREQPWY